MTSIAPSNLTRGNRRRGSGSGKRRPENRRAAQTYSTFIAYVDVPAARRAMTHVKTILQTFPTERVLQPMLWRCNQLDDARWREMALVDAARADTIVLALSEDAPLCARAEPWLTALAARFRGKSVRVLALLGDEPWIIGLQQSVVAPSTDAAVNASVEAAGPDLTLVALGEKDAAARAA